MQRRKTLNNSNLKNLLSEYERKRMDKEDEADKRKEQIYLENPRLQEIDDELSREAIKTSLLLILLIISFVVVLQILSLYV